MPAAPAPATTTRVSPMRRFVSRSAFRNAAPLMIAVPCWSSWNTGMSIEAIEPLFDLEALRRADVLEVDPAERGLEQLHGLDHELGVFSRELDVEHVDARETLEEDALALHHGLSGQRPDVAEPEHRRAVRDHGDQVPARGVERRRRPGSSGSRGRARRRRACRPSRGRARSSRTWSGRPGSSRGGPRGGSRGPSA